MVATEYNVVLIAPEPSQLKAKDATSVISPPLKPLADVGVNATNVGVENTEVVAVKLWIAAKVESNRVTVKGVGAA